MVQAKIESKKSARYVLYLYVLRHNNADEDETAEEVPTGEGLRRFGVVNETDMTELKYIVCHESLEEPLKMVPIKGCHKCEKEVVFHCKIAGCTVDVPWVILSNNVFLFR